MTLNVLFPRIRHIRPERSVTWGDRPNKDRPFEKERTPVSLSPRARPTATFVYFSSLHRRRCISDIWYGQTSRYRYLPYDGTLSHGPLAQSTLDMDPVRGTTVCNGKRYFCRLCLHSLIAVRVGVEMRNSAKHSPFLWIIFKLSTFIYTVDAYVRDWIYSSV